MYEIMGAHYDTMKNTLGIREAFGDSDSDGETEKIFQKLRPQSPYKFKDLVRNKFDPKKFNRMMGKGDKKMDHEQVKDVILYDRPMTQVPKKRMDKGQLASITDNARLLHNYVQNEN